MPNVPSDVVAPSNPEVPAAAAQARPQVSAVPVTAAVELGGPAGPEPTRFGDWERNGRCIDF
ncbi:MAG TPA: DUF1674 domain-containing protein [Steroidobacteraceae bacterium]|nr:DUF1674 domain-containing protein [Steroidobacteraceae bacterium]